MITTVDKRTFYPDGYNPISTMTIDYNEKIDLKYWISKVLNVPINEIISPKVLMKILRESQTTLPRQIVPKVGKTISNPHSLFYLYLKSMMLFDYNPVSIFHKTHYSLFEESNYRDVFNKALQKYLDPVTYLYSMQIISLIALTETRIQLLKKHSESNKNFLNAFQELIGYEIVFNSSTEFSVLDLKSITGEIEYMAFSFINTSIHENPENFINKTASLPTVILKVPEAIILFNSPAIIRNMEETLEKIYKAPFQTAKTSSAGMVTSPPTELLRIPDKLSEEDSKEAPVEGKEQGEEIFESRYDDIKNIPLTKEKENFITSGNLQLGISEPEEEFPAYL